MVLLEEEEEKKDGGAASSSWLPAAWEGSGVAAEGGTEGLRMRAAAEVMVELRRVVVAGTGAAAEAEDGGGGGGGEAPACCRHAKPTVSKSKRVTIGRCCWAKWQGVLLVVVMLLAFCGLMMCYCFSVASTLPPPAQTLRSRRRTQLLAAGGGCALCWMGQRHKVSERLLASPVHKDPSLLAIACGCYV